MKFSSIDLAQLLSDMFYCNKCKLCLADCKQTGLCNALFDQKKLKIFPETFYTDYPFIAAHIKCKFDYIKCSECILCNEDNTICIRTSKKNCSIVDNEIERLARSGREWEILNLDR